MDSGVQNRNRIFVFFNESGTVAKCSCVYKVVLLEDGKKRLKVLCEMARGASRQITNNTEFGRNSSARSHQYCSFRWLLMSFETMQRQFPSFLAFVLNRMMSKQGSFRAALRSFACDVKAAISRMSRKNAREVSSISARGWYTRDMERTEGFSAVK